MNKLYYLVLPVLLLFSCKEENIAPEPIEFDPIQKVDIHTDKGLYQSLENINLTIENNIDETLLYQYTGPYPILYERIYKREQGVWMHADLGQVISGPGPIYYGTIQPREQRHFSFKIKQPGDYKFEFRLSIAFGDEILVESNPITIAP